MRVENNMFRIFFVLTGFGLAVAGGVTTIMYLNLLTTGYTFFEYVSFIFTRVECYLLFIGMMMVSFAIYAPRRKE